MPFPFSLICFLFLIFFFFPLVPFSFSPLLRHVSYSPLHSRTISLISLSYPKFPLLPYISFSPLSAILPYTSFHFLNFSLTFHSLIFPFILSSIISASLHSNSFSYLLLIPFPSSSLPYLSSVLPYMIDAPLTLSLIPFPSPLLPSFSLLYHIFSASLYDRCSPRI